MTQVINIDELVEEQPVLVIISKGKEHKALPVSIDAFVKNLKMIETLNEKSSFADEIEVCIQVIANSFPTLAVEEIRSWQVQTIQKIFAAVRGMDGQNAEVSGEAGNPPAN